VVFVLKRAHWGWGKASVPGREGKGLSSPGNAQ